MAFTDDQIAALTAKLDSRNVATRAQQGKQLSYIEGWHAIAEANRIFGFDGWQRETVGLQMTGEPYQTDAKWRVGYLARVLIRVWNGDTWIAREGTGYGSGIGKDLNDAHESAAKEAETDAMKRALMTFGNPFGLALYDKAQSNVDHGGQANHAAMNPAADEPGGDADVAERWATWGDTQLKMLRQNSVSVETLGEWWKDNSKHIALCRKHAPTAYEMLVEFKDDLKASARGNHQTPISAG